MPKCSEAEETDEAAARLQHTSEPGAEKSVCAPANLSASHFQRYASSTLPSFDQRCKDWREQLSEVMIRQLVSISSVDNPKFVLLFFHAWYSETTVMWLQTALRGAEHRAAKAKGACEIAYSRLCMALDSAERHAAAPLSDASPQQQVQPAYSSAKALGAVRPEASHPSEQTPARLSRSGLKLPCITPLTPTLHQPLSDGDLSFMQLRPSLCLCFNSLCSSVAP